jgi:hypothetical protein
MARDFNPATKSPDANRSGGKGRGMPPMFTGILIGLLLGIMLAIGVAVWLNRAHNPFVEKSTPVETLPAFVARPTLPPVAKNEKGDADKPRFEFYQILPGDKGGGGDRASAVAPPSAKSALPPEPRPAPKAEVSALRETPKSTSTETVYLQAGAFQSQTDAENLKAKIAFSGFEAYVRPVNLPDKGTLYRVRLGPYKSSDEVNRIKATLSQNGIAAAIVKSAD